MPSSAMRRAAAAAMRARVPVGRWVLRFMEVPRAPNIAQRGRIESRPYPMSAHLHILGICGTFMGGIAAIAKAAGYRVTGCDANVYPPMSDQLRALGIELTEGFGEQQLVLRPDVWVVGNVVTRGNPLMEAILDHGERYVSGPQWLGG